MKLNVKTYFKITISLLIFIEIACSRDDRNNPGYTYFNDMAQSVAYEYYSENPNYKNGKNENPIVKGTISKDAIPYSYPNTLEGQKLAGKELINPVNNDTAEINIGKSKFKIYCAICHGEKGNGKGFLVTNKKFKKEVTSLISDFVQKKPDGELFHTITVGSVSGFMGSHSWQLKPIDRWRIVRYIKTSLKNEK